MSTTTKTTICHVTFNICTTAVATPIIARYDKAISTDVIVGNKLRRTGKVFLTNIGMGGNRVNVVKQDQIHYEDWGADVNLRVACENIKQKLVLMT